MDKFLPKNGTLMEATQRRDTGKCQNAFFFKIEKCQNWKVSEFSDYFYMGHTFQFLSEDYV